MSHEPHNAAALQIDDPEAGSTWIVSIGGIIVLAVLVICVSVFYFRFEAQEVDVKVIEPVTSWSAQLKADQLAQLETYQKYSIAGADGKDEVRVRIPIARAMELVIVDAKNPPKPSPAVPPVPTAANNPVAAPVASGGVVAK